MAVVVVVVVVISVEGASREIGKHNRSTAVTNDEGSCGFLKKQKPPPKVVRETRSETAKERERKHKPLVDPLP